MRSSSGGFTPDICPGREELTMPTEAKSEAIAELTDKLERARGAVLLTTQGLTVAEVTELRRKLRAAGLELHVVKNTLLRIAAERAHYQDLSELLHGQTAIALSYDDEIAAAKTITDYLRTARTGKPVTVKAGLLEMAPITAKQVEDLAKIPGKDQLRAQVVGTIHGPLNQLYGLLTAPMRDLVNVLEARIRQMVGEQAA
jgi:large subunit ribosomal protein L10